MLADVQNGYYAAVQNLARLPYQAIIAATFVVFPLVSRSTFTEDRDTTRRYIQVTSRYSLIFAMAIAVVMAANPVDVLGLVYAPDYARARRPALPLLALGNVAFSLFAIAGTILNGAGQDAARDGHRGDHARGRGRRQLHRDPDRAPSAATCCVVAALVTGGAMVRRRDRVGLGAAPRGSARSCRCVEPGPGRRSRPPRRSRSAASLPLHGKLMTLVEAVVGRRATFLVVLVSTRELGKRDLAGDQGGAAQARRGRC